MKDWTMRRAAPADVPAATVLLNRAYARWAALGFPAQSEERVASYLLAHGWLAWEGSALVGALCLMDAAATIEGELVTVRRPHRVDRSVLNGAVAADELRRLRLCYVYSLAADPGLRSAGVGLRLLSWAAQEAAKGGYDAILAETARAAASLLRYYRPLGCEIIGESAADEPGPRRVFLLKRLRAA